LKKYKILIVEDELIPANFIKKILEYNGHTVLGIARDENTALSYLKMTPDLLLMDINIKGDSDGIDVAESFYKYMDVAVIYLSAYSDTKLLDRANRTKPIGYLVKPIQDQTLISTIAACMSRHIKTITDEAIYLTPSSLFDPHKRTIVENDHTEVLTQRESLCLATLIRHRDRAISYEELENRIWFQDIPKESSLRTLIWRLRKKMPKEVNIENLYNSGYRIIF